MNKTFKNKKITFVFENYINFDVIADYISFELPDNTVSCIDNVSIKILESEDTLYKYYGGKFSKFNRLTEYNDIVSIIIDDVTFSIDWYSDDNPYFIPSENINQISSINENGDILISIFSSIGYNKNRIKKITSAIERFMNYNPDTQLKDMIKSFDFSKDDLSIAEDINNFLFH